MSGGRRTFIATGGEAGGGGEERKKEEGGGHGTSAGREQGALGAAAGETTGEEAQRGPSWRGGRDADRPCRRGRWRRGGGQYGIYDKWEK